VVAPDKGQRQVRELGGDGAAPPEERWWGNRPLLLPGRCLAARLTPAPPARRHFTRRTGYSGAYW
jgi:hypothetical protein